MAVVLSSEENSYFSQTSLRRSHSQPKFGTKRAGFHTSASASRISDIYPESSRGYPASPSSPAPSSPVAIHPESAGLSCSSTLTDNFSLEPDCEGVDRLGNAGTVH